MQNPSLPKALFSMYSQAKQAAYDDLEAAEVLKVTLPWVNQDFGGYQSADGRELLAVWREGQPQSTGAGHALHPRAGLGETPSPRRRDIPPIDTEANRGLSDLSWAAKMY